MKKLCVGVLLAFGLLFAQTASAGPCGICQSPDPCTACENCVRGFGGPGLWIEDGYCWGDIEPGTCGYCPEQLTSDGHSAPFMDQDVDPDEGLSYCPL